MITIEQARQLQHGQIIHYQLDYIKAKCDNWRINGQIHSLKRSPKQFEIPIKYGLYTYGYLNERNANTFHLPSECNNSIKG